LLINSATEGVSYEHNANQRFGNTSFSLSRISNAFTRQNTVNLLFQKRCAH